MCHMFLVPVFETGSLRTFQLSPHTEAARARGGGGGGGGGRGGREREEGNRKTHKRETGREG